MQIPRIFPILKDSYWAFTVINIKKNSLLRFRQRSVVPMIEDGGPVAAFYPPYIPRLLFCVGYYSTVLQTKLSN